MDLSPREVDAGARRSRKWLWLIGLGVAAVAGFILLQALGEATLFFRNVDEAIADRDELGDRRFRLQGRVVPGSVIDAAGVVTFDLMFACDWATVNHVGDPPELFDNPWVPVLLEGRWQEGASTAGHGFVFSSDTIIVKHTNEYEAKAVDDAGRQAALAEEPPAGFLDDCSGLPPALQAAA